VFLEDTVELVDEQLAKAPASVADEGQRRAKEVADVEKLWQDVEAIR